MKALLHWLDTHLLLILTGFLLVFIPLYPKLPLAELLQGYIVRLRLEDILILVAFLVYLVQLARRVVPPPRHPLAYAILAYLTVGLLSTLSAIYVTHTVPDARDHLLKIWLHWFRRIEYFSVFFLAYASIRHKSDLKLLIKIMVLTLLGVVVYGMGQKYLYWPAFSTMNREFSKGVRLYLQPNTRLFSTFGGHYDLAAYLSILLSLLVPAAWTAKKWLSSLALGALFLLAYWCLVLTTSRTSFVGYLVSLTLVAWLLRRHYSTWWVLKRYLATLFASLIIMFSFSNLLERFTQVIPNPDTRTAILAIQSRLNEPFVKEPDGKSGVAEIPSLLALLFKSKPLAPIELTPVERADLGFIASPSDLPPTSASPLPTPLLPSDVSPGEQAIRDAAAVDSGKPPVVGSYSPNALKYGLSMGIRLDVLWPQAIAGFLSNPLLGSGYSTLVKRTVGDFTYAESTDNDYLRILGETGLLGLITFFACVLLVVRAALVLTRSPNRLDYLLGLGGVGATAALLTTAVYIDVFESSKVAYTYWMFAALIYYRYQHYEATSR